MRKHLVFAFLNTLLDEETNDGKEKQKKSTAELKLTWKIHTFRACIADYFSTPHFL